MKITREQLRRLITEQARGADSPMISQLKDHLNEYIKKEDAGGLLAELEALQEVISVWSNAEILQK